MPTGTYYGEEKNERKYICAVRRPLRTEPKHVEITSTALPLRYGTSLTRADYKTNSRMRMCISIIPYGVMTRIDARILNVKHG